MDKYLQIVKNVAETLGSIPFFKFGLPVITVVGVAAFLYYGYTGVVYQRTIFLVPLRSQSGIATRAADLQQGSGPIEGVWAVVMGIVYIITGVLLAVILAPVCYFIYAK